MLDGGAGNDLFTLDLSEYASGHDTLYAFGGEGTDTLSAGDGLQFQDWGPFVDRGLFQISGFGGQFELSLQDGTGYAQYVDGVGIEQVTIETASDLDLTLTGDLTGTAVTARGTEGDDRIDAASLDAHGASGSEGLVLDGGLGFDSLTGSQFVDDLSGGDDDDDLRGVGGDDVLRGGAGDDSLYGGDGADRTEGGEGDDYFGLDVGQGSDTISGGAGRDFYSIAVEAAFFGAEADTVVIEDFEAGEVLRLWVGPFTSTEPFFPVSFHGTGAFTGVAGEVRYEAADGRTRVEWDVTGDGEADHVTILANGAFALRDVGHGPDVSLRIDTPFGTTSDEDDLVYGDELDDAIDGGLGDDALDGAGGDDMLSGGAGNDDLTGGAGDDLMLGGAGDDFFRVAARHDTVEGGGGRDDLYLTYRGALALTVGDGIVTEANGGHAVDFSGVEIVTVTRRLAVAADDVLDASASSAAVQFYAGQGDDVVVGSAFDDLILEGDRGDDTLTGGTGADTFDVDYLYEIEGAGDVITDFEPGDVLDLFEIVLAGRYFGEEGGQELSFVGWQDGAGEGFTGRAGEVAYRFAGDATVLEVDADGDGLGDHQVTLTNGALHLQELVNEFGEGLRFAVSRDDASSLGADTLVGSNADDVEYAQAGDDTVRGLDGDDRLFGEGGDDLLFGGEGNDVLDGGAGGDLIYGDGVI